MSQAAERVENSIHPVHRVNFEEVNWTELRDAGSYVDAETGNLFRFPQEALIRGMSPIVTLESRSGARLIRLSHDPYEITPKLRVLAAQNGVRPNF